MCYALQYLKWGERLVCLSDCRKSATIGIRRHSHKENFINRLTMQFRQVLHTRWGGLALCVCVAFVMSLCWWSDIFPEPEPVHPSGRIPSAYVAEKGRLFGVSVADSVKVINSKYFPNAVSEATNHVRKRRMVDLTKNPEDNTLQVLTNIWTEGSFSPIHKHTEYSEVFVALEGALAMFTMSEDGSAVKCDVLEPNSNNAEASVAVVIEKGQYHAMTAAPKELGYVGYAVVFEISGHKYEPSKATKTLAPFSTALDDGLNGSPDYFKEKLLVTCPRKL